MNSDKENPRVEFRVNYPLPKSKDSLLALLKLIPEDTNRINVLNILSWKMMSANIDSSIVLGTEALSLSNKLNWEKGRAKACAVQGVFYALKADCPKALELLLEALKLDEGLKNKKGVATHLGDIGNVYDLQGDYAMAMEFFLKALALDEELNNKIGVERHLGNIGNVQKSLNNYPKAIEFYKKALLIAMELEHEEGIALHLGSIGGVYANMGEESSVQSARDSLFNQASEYLTKALNEYKKLEDDIGVARNLGNLGYVFMGQHKYLTASSYLYQAINISGNVGALDDQRLFYEMLSTLYEKSDVSLPDSIGGENLNIEQMRLKSLYYYKRYVSIRDTLFSEENKKEMVRKEMSYEFNKKEAVTKAENDKKEALAKVQLSQKEKERNYFIAGFGLVLILAGFIFRSYRQKQNANAIISHQKAIVEEKQKDLLDSIHYAKRIQQSLLPTEKSIARSLNKLLHKK